MKRLETGGLSQFTPSWLAALALGLALLGPAAACERVHARSGGRGSAKLPGLKLDATHRVAAPFRHGRLASCDPGAGTADY